MSSNERNRNSLVQDMKDTFEAVLKEFGISIPDSDKASTKFVKKISQMWGGCNIYFVKGPGINIDERNQKMKSEFNGKNQFELSRKYAISIQLVYRILKED